MPKTNELLRCTSGAVLVTNLEDQLARTRKAVLWFVEESYRVGVSHDQETASFEAIEDLRDAVLSLRRPDEDNYWRWVRATWLRHYHEFMDRLDSGKKSELHDALEYLENIMLPFLPITRDFCPADPAPVFRLASVIALDDLRNAVLGKEPTA